MTDVDNYITMLRESQLKRTVVIDDVDKIISENAQLKEEYEAECHRADELEDSFWKEHKENARLKELLNKIKTQCELLIPKNGLSPVGDRERLCKAFLNLIDEVLK